MGKINSAEDKMGEVSRVIDTLLDLVSRPNDPKR